MKYLKYILLFIISMNTMFSQVDRTKVPKEGKTPVFKLPEIQSFRLSNGLKVKFIQYRQLPIVQLQFVFYAGSAHDPQNKAGLVNLIMRLLDAGTKNRTIFEIADELEFLGARFSANTSYDGSFVSLLTLKKHLEKSLELTSDILQNSIFPDSEFNRVKDEVLTSLIQQKDRADVTANKVFSKIVYNDQHPYAKPIDGTESSVKNISVSDLREFYKKYFSPENAVLIVVGDTKSKELKALLEKYFSSWKSSKHKLPDIPKVNVDYNPGLFIVDKPNAPQSQIRVGCIGVDRNNPDYYALEVMNMILGGNFNSRINWNLREQKGYTYGARSSFMYRKQLGAFNAGGGFKSSVTDSCIIELLYEIQRMRDTDVSVDELKFAKNSIILSFPRNFETPAQIASQVATLELYNLPDNYFNNYISKIEKMKIEDVRRVSKKYLNPEKMSIVVVGDYNATKSSLEKLNFGKIKLLDTEGNPVND